MRETCTGLDTFAEAVSPYTRLHDLGFSQVLGLPFRVLASDLVLISFRFGLFWEIRRRDVGF